MPNVRIRCLLILTTLVFAGFPARSPAATPKIAVGKPPVPNWLWVEKEKENQSVGFRTSFELPADKGAVQGAALWMTCDNVVVAYVNGQKVGENPIWQVPVTVDITKALRPGKNVLAFQATNE